MDMMGLLRLADRRHYITSDPDIIGERNFPAIVHFSGRSLVPSFEFSLTGRAFVT